MAAYRRFISYIYAYRNGKKEKNTGFAKAEARGRSLKISIQMETAGNREGSLDAYGFLRKGEKLSGIFLGEMKKSSGTQARLQYFLKVETDTEDLMESGYALDQLSGLWIKGGPGENYITVWDEEPVTRMELEIEIQEEKDTADAENTTEPELEKSEPKTARQETPESEKPEPEAPESKKPEPEVLKSEETKAETVKAEKPINGVRAQEAEFLAGTEADERTEKQKVQEITDKLEEGLKELFESEKYKTYLSTMSKFHNYSFNNTLLIAMQKPEATLVAGYKAWQKNFERHVNKGEKAIRILAPAPYKIKEERDKLDPVTGEMMFDENGMPQKEQVEVTIPAFRAVSVFDVSQTDGKPIPELEAQELLSTV